jgi:hypothetical protein
MSTLDRFVPLAGMHRRARARAGGWPARRQQRPVRLQRVRAALPVVCGIGMAAVAGWLLAGGSLSSAEALFGQREPAAVDHAAGDAPVHLESLPSGAAVRIDGATRGKTPLDTWLSAGQHVLSLQHSDTLDDDQTLAVAETGAHVEVALWRRRPEVVPVRPVYPGASLVDARFLDDGQVALLVGLPAQAGAPGVSRELWRLDPSTGKVARVRVRGVEGAASTMVLAPDGEQVAYVTPGSSAAVTASLWPVTANTSAAPPQESHPEAVWVASLDATEPPRRIFELASGSTPATSGGPEHIVDLVWVPDGSRLVAITRQAGPPARARVVLLNVPAPETADDQPAQSELVLLPADVQAGSAVPDPSGRWLALVTHSAVAPGGSDLLNLCVLQLQPGGLIRDLADLGLAARASSAAPLAWPPAASSTPDRLVFVGPAPAAASGGGGPFGIFGIFSAFRPSAPPSGLFVANLAASGLEDAQPRRLGTSVNAFGPVWRSENALLGFARQNDGTLALWSIEPTSGAVRDLGVRLPAGVAQGAGLSARWDTPQGHALLLSYPPNSGTGGASLQAWLVSFAPSSTPGATH